MTTDLLTEEPVFPDLDGFVTCYGVAVAFVGEDSETAVMFGHVEPRRALAAVNQATRTSLGWRMADEIWVGPGKLLDGFKQRWAYVMTHCDDDAGWWLDYSETNMADTPGAFPVTIFDL